MSENSLRSVLAEVSKHYTVTVNNPDYPEKDNILISWSQCVCGEAKASGTREYKYIWAEHIEQVWNRAALAATQEPQREMTADELYCATDCPTCKAARAAGVPAASGRFAEGRMLQFKRMTEERPIDPCYWDMHEKREIEEAIEREKAAAPRPELAPTDRDRAHRFLFPGIVDPAILSPWMLRDIERLAGEFAAIRGEREAPPDLAVAEPRLCGQCGKGHTIPEGAECLRMTQEARQEAAMWAMKAELNCDWVREHYVPIKKIVALAQLKVQR